jgi:phosphatidylserine/phosphatidylglycerophosphate/cardiolipin synthase-like enzyme
LELIHHARKRLLIVTFAAYRAALMQEAIGSAIRRGVSFHFIGESVHESGGKITFDAFSAFDEPGGNTAKVFIWPQQQRLMDHEGKSGSLHVKCAVADEDYLLLSSANMTEYAMSLNMEVGALIKGGSLPAQVVHHFDRLIQNSILDLLQKSLGIC